MGSGRGNVVSRDKWVLASDVHVERHLEIGELDAPERIAASKEALAEAGKSFVTTLAQPLGVDFFRRHRTFDQARDGFVAGNAKEGESPPG